MLPYTPHPEVRSRLEELENRTLSRFAARSADASGRRWPQEDDPLRTAYQRDRDRVIHSKAFRRLKHKTQVFIAPKGDHYRTRLTHTMEVTQVARTIARALRLNEDLTEATGLGARPRAHAVRARRRGRDGRDPGALPPQRAERAGGRVPGARRARPESRRAGARRHPAPLEAARERGGRRLGRRQHPGRPDREAGRQHRVSRARHRRCASAPGSSPQSRIPASSARRSADSTGERIEALVSDIVDYNWRVATGDGATWRDAVGNGIAIGISPPTLQLFNGLREFMFSNVYTASDAKVDNPKTVFVIHALFEHFCRKPEEMPAEFQENPRDEPLERRVADYIAGMTDRFAVEDVRADVRAARVGRVLVGEHSRL